MQALQKTEYDERIRSLLRDAQAPRLQSESYFQVFLTIA